MNYNIADINICINGLVKKELSIEIWSQFLSNNIFQDNVVINVVSRKSIDYQIERYFISEYYEQVFRYEAEVFLANKDMSVCTVLNCSNMGNFMILINHIFYANAIRKNYSTIT